MALDRITLTHFRNHGATRLEGTAHFNLLVGENGAGKTNVLEALSLLAPGRGLRRAALSEMAEKDSANGFGVAAELTAGNAEPVRLGTAIEPTRPGRRLVSVNGAPASAVSLAEWLSLSWLTPAMDRLFVESAGDRRRYLDRLALALDPEHVRHAARYQAALRERNRLLAEDADPEARWLDAIEAPMAEAGASLAAGRAALVERLSGALAALPEAPFARPQLRFEAGGPLEAGKLREILARHRARDRAARRSMLGPHRDELVVTMAGKDMPAAECSTGEQKAMLIALTLAHASLAAGPRPALLLLDEVAAHLDPVRRAALFERLRVSGAQVWLTGTERAPFVDIQHEAAVWRVSGGAVERV